MNEVKLTKTQIKEYDGIHCPRCHSSNFTSSPIDADGTTGKADVTCTDCGLTWTDLARLYHHHWKIDGLDKDNIFQDPRYKKKVSTSARPAIRTKE